MVDAIILSYRDFLDDRHAKNAKQINQSTRLRADELKTEIKTKEQAHFAWRETVPPIFRATPVVTANGATMVLPNRREQELDAISKLLQDNFLSQQDVQAKLVTLRAMVAEQQSRDEVEFWIMHSLSTNTGSGNGQGGGGGGGASLLQGPPAKAVIDSQLMAARTLEARLLKVAGPDHEDVRKIQGEIETILSFYRQHGIQAPRLEPIPGDSRPSQLRGQGTGANPDLAVIYERTLENQSDFLKNQELALRTQLDTSETKAKQAAMLELEDQRQGGNRRPQEGVDDPQRRHRRVQAVTR